MTIRRAIVAIAVVAWTVLEGGAGACADDPLATARATVASANTRLHADFAAAKRHSDDAYDIVTRLAEENESFDSNRARSDPGYASDKAVQASLDAAWVTAVTSGVCAAPAPSGASETCFRSSSDGTLQPLAIYIPPSLEIGPATRLVMALHGRGETESDLLSRRELQRLADATHAIVVAPYGRGRAVYDATATADVFDALDAARKTFPAAAAPPYLAGFSMGGIATFHIAAAAPKRFAAVLCVAGTLVPADRDAFAAFTGPTYVVAGERDTTMPPDLGKATVSYVRGTGRSAIYYEQPGGIHSLPSLDPAMTRAWHDMFAGTRSPVQFDQSAPGAAPAPSGPPSILQRPT